MFRTGLWIVRIANAVLLSLLLLCAALPLAVHAQAWPARPVRIVAPFSAGGSADTLGRIVAQKLTESLKQPFVIENRAGAGGFVGSEMVAKAQPDGYTLVISGIASHIIAVAVARQPPFDPNRDFTHIALIGGPPIAVITHPSVPSRNLKDMSTFNTQVDHMLQGFVNFQFLGRLINSDSGFVTDAAFQSGGQPLLINSATRLSFESCLKIAIT